MSDLGIGDRVLLLMLERVHDGAITKFFGYFEDGRRIFSSPVTSGFEALVKTGYLYLQSGRPPELEDHVGLTIEQRTRRVCFTEKGLAEYRKLSEAAARC